MNFSLRVSAMLILVLSFSLGLTAIFSYVKFEKALAGVVTSRYNTALRIIADSIESGLGIGLSLGEIQNDRLLIDRAFVQHPDLLAAELLDGAGRRVFARTRAGRTIQPEWRAAAQPRQAWTGISAEAISMGLPVSNSFGQQSGMLVLDFSRQGYDEPLHDIAAFIAEACLAIGVAGAVLSLFLGQVLIRPFNVSLDALEREVAGRGHAAGAPIEAEIRAITRSRP